VQSNFTFVYCGGRVCVYPHFISLKPLNGCRLNLVLDCVLKSASGL